MSYTYDAKNQLVSVTRGTDTWVYAYDLNGNILSVTKNNATTPEKTYGYTDSTWKDLLTSFNGSTITYDEIGNPLQYRNGIELTWTNGRKLASFTKNGATTTFTYDGEGNRIEKVSGNTAIDYIVIGGTIYGEIRTENGVATMLHYLFDENGNRIGFVVNGTDTYYYRFNLQGDVTGIYDSTGTLKAEYVYDAWGNPLPCDSDDDELAALNPIRYRGYYYDFETGLYYLQSRYYDPETGRFINADNSLYRDNVLGLNQFIYCYNNPVILFDPTGLSGELAIEWAFQAWWLTTIDSWLPIGDIIFWGGLIYFGVVALDLAISSADDDYDAPSSDSSSKKNDIPDSKNDIPSGDEIPDIEYPGDDPTVAPDGYEWKGPDPQGGKRGGYKNKNPKLKDSWHPDFHHQLPKGPHWDYNDVFGRKWTVKINEVGRTILQIWKNDKVIFELIK